MPSLNLVKNMILAENAVLVFRNYLFLSRTMKNMVKLAIFLSVILYLYALIHYFWASMSIIKFSDKVGFTLILIYNILSKFNTIVAIVLSFINSNSFKSYVDGVDAVHGLCNHKILYLNCMRYCNRRVNIVAFLCIVTSSGVFPLNFMDYQGIKSMKKRVIIDSILNASVQYRFVMESVAFYTYIEVVIAGLQYLTDAVLAAADKLKDGAGAGCGTEELMKLNKDLNHWGTVSQLLVNCSYQLNTCFGIQIGLSLFSAVFYYIILIYQCISQLAKKNMMNIELTGFGLLLILLILIAIKILIVNAGQRARNEAGRLCTSLAALRTHLVGIPGYEAAACALAVAGLTRRLRAAPLRLRLLSSLTLQMALLAEILATVADYTIVLLQFNHVV